jgi:ABC-type bacteriocin/lantibiotic exporter with double-glycine peptidase domain
MDTKFQLNRIRSSSGIASALFILLAMAACAAPTPRRAQVLSKEAVVLDMPFVQQDEMYACGLVSLSALCSYWNKEIPASEREELARTAQDHEGLSGGEMCDALARLGFETFLFEGALDRSPTGLLAHVDAGRPVLVMISPEPGKHHYVLFLGYDEPQRDACLLDPVRGRVIVPYETFDRTWQACDRFALLALPKASADRLSAANKSMQP